MHFAWAWYSRPARQQCAHTYIIGGAAGRARARAPGVPRVVSLLPSHAARTGEIDQQTYQRAIQSIFKPVRRYTPNIEQTDKPEGETLADIC